LALRTEKQLPTVAARLSHAALGLLTENGEIVTSVKRIVIYNKPMDTPDDKGKTLRDHMAEEIGDAFWYVAIATDALMLDPVLLLYPSSADNVIRPISDLSFELGGYVGRFADTIRFMTHGIDVTPLSNERVILRNSLANIVRILNQFCISLEIDLGTVLQANIDKLRERFPNAYSDEAAEARLDKGGLDARNS
jgi:NTP pyrophosphatase (non-canonical NTP hydrolase)